MSTIARQEQLECADKTSGVVDNGDRAGRGFIATRTSTQSAVILYEQCEWRVFTARPSWLGIFSVSVSSFAPSPDGVMALVCICRRGKAHLDLGTT